jgi:hypothetical protein
MRYVHRVYPCSCVPQAIELPSGNAKLQSLQARYDEELDAREQPKKAKKGAAAAVDSKKSNGVMVNCYRPLNQAQLYRGMDLLRLYSHEGVRDWVSMQYKYRPSFCCCDSAMRWIHASLFQILTTSFLSAGEQPRHQCYRLHV